MSTPFQFRKNELVLIRMFRILSEQSRRADLVMFAKEICQQLPNNIFSEFVEIEVEDIDLDTKIGLLLKDTIPSWHVVAQHVGDYCLDMLDRALGDEISELPKILGGWENDDKYLTESLIESISFYSDLYPGFEPDWDIELVQDFLDDWRIRFFDKLILLAESNQTTST